MKRIILIAHISLDGFAAGPKGELNGFPAGEENLEFVNFLTEDADTALFGRVSYELLNKYWPIAKDANNATKGEIAYSNWYNKANKMVVSNTMDKEPLDKTVITGADIPSEIIALKQQAGKNILIFGSPATSQLLMQHGLIDEYWIFVNPVIFGQGISLFAPLLSKTALTLLTTRKFANGEIALHYEVDKR